MRVIGIEVPAMRRRSAVYDLEQGLLSHRLHSQVAMHQAYGGVVPNSRPGSRPEAPALFGRRWSGGIGSDVHRRRGVHGGRVS